MSSHLKQKAKIFLLVQSSCSCLFPQLLLSKFSIPPTSVDVADINLRTPLHWAAAHGYHDQAKMLTKLGADIGLIDVEGKTPVHWAASSDTDQSAKLVSLLIGIKPRYFSIKHSN